MKRKTVSAWVNRDGSMQQVSREAVEKAGLKLFLKDEQVLIYQDQNQTLIGIPGEGLAWSHGACTRYLLKHHQGVLNAQK